MIIYTIGHSTREISEFIDILQTYGIDLLADVRTIPKSRHNPQYGADFLAEVLKEHNIEYVHLASLGGLRHSTKDSINKGWRNTSFRGYADYMQTQEFEQGTDQLIELATIKTAAIMCAEAVPWRCHRSMIGDALLVRKIEVIDIFDKNKAQKEKLTSFANVQGHKISYPEK
jgi:uncharacterized protein (DUF488 family)